MLLYTNLERIMSKTFIKINIKKVPESYMWQQLNALIQDSLANALGNNEFEFFKYGDAIGFQTTCDELGVDYQVTDFSED